MAITTNYRTRSDAVPLKSFKAQGRPSAIAGVGVYAPDRVISNFDLEKMMDTSDKWITERTGIHRRHIAEDGTTTFDVATRAARAAFVATSNVVVPSSAMWRRWMPVRSVIHLSEVSIIFSRSKLVSTLSGA